MKKNKRISDGICRHGFLFNWTDFTEDHGACPVCGHDGPRERISRIARENDLYFMRCPKCLAISSSHYVNKEPLDNFYALYFSALNLAALRLRMENYKNYANFLSTTLNCEQDTIRILDYGGGGGGIAYEVAKHLTACGACKRVDAVVVDYSENRVKFNHPKVSVSHMTPDSKSWRDLKFDVVMANDVIEHIFQVKPVIDNLLGCVERGGFLVIKTAYMQPIYKLLLSFGWQSLSLICYPEHIHDFSAGFFARFFKTFNRSDFTIIASEPSFFQHKLFGKHFASALAARIIRAPYHFFKNYPLVGGWQLIAQRSAD